MIDGSPNYGVDGGHGGRKRLQVKLIKRYTTAEN